MFARGGFAAARGDAARADHARLRMLAAACFFGHWECFLWYQRSSLCAVPKKPPAGLTKPPAGFSVAVPAQLMVQWRNAVPRPARDRAAEVRRSFAPSRLRAVPNREGLIPVSDSSQIITHSPNILRLDRQRTKGETASTPDNRAGCSGPAETGSSSTRAVSNAKLVEPSDSRPVSNISIPWDTSIARRANRRGRGRCSCR
jgi:hypothetical protein